MNTTTDITTPLYDNGPSIDDLNADGSPWRIPLDLIDDYLEAVGPGPSRQLINQHEANLDGVRKATLRDIARMDCGEPPLWPEQHVMMWPDRAREVGAISIRDPRDYANVSTGWPYPEMVNLLAFSLHLHYREQALNRRKQRIAHERLEAARVYCALCGDQVFGGGDICHTCRPIIAHAQLLKCANEQIGKHTRIEHAMNYLEELA